MPINKKRCSANANKSYGFCTFAAKLLIMYDQKIQDDLFYGSSDVSSDTTVV